MAAPTPTEVRQRIAAIVGTVPNITTVLTGTEANVAETDLPAALVFTGPATREDNSRDQRFVTRQYQIVLLVERLDKDRKDATHTRESKNTVQQQIPALEAAEAWLDVVPDFFRKHADRLELEKVGLVWSTAPASDSGPETFEWVGGAFAACIWTLPVTTRRDK